MMWKMNSVLEGWNMQELGTQQLVMLTEDGDDLDGLTAAWLHKIRWIWALNKV